MSVAKNISRVSLVAGLLLFIMYTIYSTAQAGWLPFSVPQVPILVSFLLILLMSILFGTSIFIEGEVLLDQDESVYEET